MQNLDPNLVDEDYPLQRHLGYRMVAWADGMARFELPLQPFLTNRYGIPHGGIHATLLDTAMGYAGSWTGDRDRPRLAMTLSLTVNFVGQAQGNLLVAEARRVGGGRKTYFVEGSVADELGTLVATGSGVFRYRG